MNSQITEKVSACPACGEGVLQPEIERQTVSYHGKTGEIELHFAVCDTCGSDLTDAINARHNKRAMNAFKKQVDGLLTGVEIRAFREHFGLTQKTAAALIGGGEVAFSRYESDDIVQSAAMDTALRLCIEHPSNLLTLAKMHNQKLPDRALDAIRGTRKGVSFRFVRAHLDAKTSSGMAARTSSSGRFVGIHKNTASLVRRECRFSA